MKLRQTKNDLPETSRLKCVPLLNENLASAIDLALQAKQAHWNVRGPHFFQLHELFDKVYDAANEWVDDIAERTVQLGGIAEGTLAVVSQRTKLMAYGLDITAGRDHVDALSRALAVFGKSVRDAIDRASDAKDADTADLFTGISRDADKMLWFVESHLTGD